MKKNIYDYRQLIKQAVESDEFTNTVTLFESEYWDIENDHRKIMRNLAYDEVAKLSQTELITMVSEALTRDLTIEFEQETDIYDPENWED